MASQLIQKSRYVLGGTPVFARTHVSVRALIDYLEDAKSLHDFLNDFPTVNRKQATAVLEKLKVLLGEKRASFV